MTYAELVLHLARASRLQRKQVDTVLRHFTRVVPEAAKSGRVPLPGLGTFVLGTRKGRIVRNPVTKELQHLPASRTLSFRAARVAKERVSR